MGLRQPTQVTPPLESDRSLVDFSAIVQANLSELFQKGHAHVGQQGVLTSAPAANQGSVGDILLGVVGGSAYIYFKTGAATWYRLGPATAV